VLPEYFTIFRWIAWLNLKYPARSPRAWFEHLLVQRADLVDLAVARIDAGEFAGERLERAHYRQGFRQPGGIDLGNDRAAVRQQLDQAFGSEYLEGFAQWGA